MIYRGGFTFGTISKKKQSRVEWVRQGLLKMLGSESHRQQFSLFLNILPIYLSAEYVEEFCNNGKISEYIDYIDTKKPNKA